METIRQVATKQLAATIPAQTLPAVKPQTTIAHTEAQSLTGDARKGVLDALNAIMQRTGYPLKRAAKHLISLAQKEEASPQLIAMLKLARDGRGRSSPDGMPSDRSLTRFVAYQKSGELVPKKREKDMNVPAWAESFLGHYQKPEKPTVEHAYRQFAKMYQDDLPSVHQVRRFLDKVGNVSRQIGRMGDRELKTIKKFVRRDFSKLLPSDIYSADGHTFDAEVQHPMHGRPFRPEITSVIDIGTRRLIGWSVDLAESALAVLDALRVAALTGARGNPAVIDYDHQTLWKEKNGQPAPAAGWFKTLEWREGVGLFAIDVEWTPAAALAIETSEYRFISPVINFDANTGRITKLTMAALTNYAGIDGMQQARLAALSPSSGQ
ncbi:phage protease [Undibacterium sp. TC9W]